MFIRAFKVIFGIMALASVGTLGAISAASAQPRSDTVVLHTYAPVGPSGRLVVTGFRIGRIIRTQASGQIFGFAVNQHGTDGLLASSKPGRRQGQVIASVQTFDQVTAKITKVFATSQTMDDNVTNGIFGMDVGLVEHEHVANLHVTRSFKTMNPVTSKTFTGVWTPPNGANILVNQFAGNQKNGMAAVLAEDSSGPFVFSSDIPANTFGQAFRLDPNTFGGGDQPQLAQDVLHNRAVIATSPDGGAVGGKVPLIALIDLRTGKIRSFNGVVIPPFNSGYVNGLAVDSATGIACTTTELDAQVEFYNLANGIGFHVGLPGANGNQGQTGGVVVSDPIHKLFLVAQPNGSVGPQGDSVVDVFDEHGNLIESITGFKSLFVPGMAVNPAKRMGFINGPTFDAIQEFTY